MSPKIEINEVTTKILLARIPELLRHQGFDRAALAAQVLHVEGRAISPDELRKLTVTERAAIHAALAYVGKGLLELQNELTAVDIPHALKLIEGSINSCDDVALAPLIATLQPHLVACSNARGVKVAFHAAQRSPARVGHR